MSTRQVIRARRHIWASSGGTLLMAALAIIVVSLVGHHQAQANDPALEWKTLETPHFIIHYHAGLDAMAERTAVLCEEAHLVLEPKLRWAPRSPTHVVLDDLLDTANGLATTIPRNRIRLFMTGPLGRGNLGDYDDWLRLLVYHEYAHILHIDNIGGVPAVINGVLGKTIMPNQYFPRWYTEGLATYYESTLTSGGRAYASLAHMEIRTAYLEGKLLDLGQLTGNPTSWPRGSAAYIYGSHFLTYVADTRGEDFFPEVHTRYGTHLIPFALNNTARDILRTDDFVTLWAEWNAHLAGRYEAQLLKVRLEGATKVEYVTDRGGYSDAPIPRPNHRQVSFYRSDGYALTGIYGYDLDTGAMELIFPINAGAGSHGWDPTGRYLFYHTTRMHKGIYAYNELVVADTTTGEDIQITDGARAREPAVHPEGKRLAYVSNGSGKTDLMVYDFETREHTKLVQSGAAGQMDTPAYSPDGRLIAFSYWRGHDRDIYVYDTERRVLVQVTSDRALDLEPSFSPEGDALLFSSDRTGFYDIYAAELRGLDDALAEARAQRCATASLSQGRCELEAPVAGDGATRVELPIHRLSRVQRGVFSPVVVDDGERRWVYVTAFNAEGFNLGRFPYEPVAQAPLAPESAIVRREIVPPEVGEPVLAHSPYEPQRYLAPLSVFPLMAFTNSGRDSYGAELVGYDPVGHHAWSMVGEYFNANNSAFMAGQYSYSRLPVAVAVGAQYATAERARSFVAESRFIPFHEAAYDAQLSLVAPILGATHVQTLALGYNFRLTDYLEEPEYTPEPADTSTIRPRMGNFSSVLLTWNSSSTDSEAHSVGAEKGYNLKLGVRFRDRFTGSDFASSEATYSGKVYLPVPYLDNHVLNLRITGGIGRSDFRGSLYSLGGLPPQEVFSAVLNDTPLGGTYLRGYEPFAFAGNQYHMVSNEYRMPLVDVNYGFDTLPFFIRRVTVAAFADYGAAFDGPLRDAEFHAGTGAELRITTLMGYNLPGSFRLGYARGFGEKGINDFYLFFGGVF